MNDAERLEWASRIARAEARAEAAEDYYTRNAGALKERDAALARVKAAEKCVFCGENAWFGPVTASDGVVETIAQHPSFHPCYAKPLARVAELEARVKAFESVFNWRNSGGEREDAALARVKELELYIEADWDAGSKRKLRARVAELEGALGGLVDALTANLEKALDWGTIASVRHAQAIAKDAVDRARRVLEGNGDKDTARNRAAPDTLSGV